MSTTSPTQFQNFIGGKWCASSSGKTFLSTNPARTSDTIGTYQSSTVEDLEAAIEAATRAQKGWASTPAPVRGEILMKAAQLMDEQREELARLMTREMGKILKETRGEVQVSIDVARFIAGEGRRAEGETVPSGLPNKFCMTVRHPLGIVGIITPWNFPLSIPVWKTLPALMAGNAVILKPASDTPALSLKLAEILQQAGLPDGVLNVLTGSGGTLGTALASHKRVNMISLTGSTEVGKQVAEICGRDLRRCALELGGKNAVIILEDGDLDLAAESVALGAFGTTGQRCTATSRVIIQRSVLKAFTERLLAITEKLRIGDGLDEQVDMGPLVNMGRVKAVHEYAQIGKQEGAKLVTGGAPLTDGAHSEGAFYQPTIFTEVQPEMRIAREEIFGPFVSLIPVANYEEAIEVANGSQYGLSTAIFTEDMRYTFRAIRDIESGLVYVNAGTTGSEIHLPFGGMKQSGNGHRELGSSAVDEFSEVKSIFVSYPPHK
ncbi:aldehyde dehydrogenase (NAD+) [Thermosporothrix hazakensis]|jgi:aldehyde dehydrogenase (NAD+)|uniref:Aldehyde dehydrogenase (NAD+) n=1 Tax=Thermosporothrix hazakensis TaxID=644383 RepID=A0A326U4G1_THEHA|nr:aldehyde dehydrogenase family protein [Thermosporothrix hazakensis]PZW26661.1 aldehyde dehydrogenase (NAD+) [Thermosporothrix hazakensis]GCE47637.1 aldehyde dehydrogenase [Thermosporothrix hazakensis]